LQGQSKFAYYANFWGADGERAKSFQLYVLTGRRSTHFETIVLLEETTRQGLFLKIYIIFVYLSRAGLASNSDFQESFLVFDIPREFLMRAGWSWLESRK